MDLPRDRKWADWSYLTGLAVFFAYRTFFNTTMRRALSIKRIRTAEHIWLLLMLVLFAAKLLYWKCYSAWEMGFSIFLLGLSGMVWYQSHTYWILMLPLLIINAKGVPFARILKVYLLVNGVILGLACILSLTGAIPNLSFPKYIWEEAYAENGYVAYYRYSFGTTYPTTLSEFVFFWCAALIYLRKGVLKLYDMILPAVLMVVLYRYCHAITGTACQGMLLLIVAWALLRRRIPQKASRIVDKTGVVLVPVMPLLAGLMSVLMIGYNGEDPQWYMLDQRMHWRIGLGNYGFRTYGIHPFGSWVKYQANTQKENYFNIDCSYHMVLINFGVIFFCVILGMFAWYSWRAWKTGDFVLLLILFVAALECVMENRLIQPQYNVFCLLLFADWNPPRKGDSEIAQSL